MSVAGRCALVTGASSGLGTEFARELAGRGCSLVLVARRIDKLQQLAEELRSEHGVEVDAIACDLLGSGAVTTLLGQLRSDIDILINNAGIGVYNAFMDTPWERLERMMRLDVQVPMELTRRLASGMQARGFGYVLQVASVAAYQPAPLYAAYGAAKAAVLSFGEALDYELSGSGVSCTVLCPGVTRTQFFEVAEQELTLYQRVMMMNAPDVAAIGIRALLRRKRVVVPGLLNKIGVWLARLAPRRLATASAHLMMKQPH